MRSQIWLINTQSGRHQGAKVAESVKGLVEIRCLDFSKLPEQLQEASGFDRIAVAGGDGTYSSILTSPALPPRPIGLIPVGTANDLAREVGTYHAFVGRKWHELPSIIDTLTERQLAIWDLTIDGKTQSFCNYCSLGFEGAVVSDFAAWRTQQKTHSSLKNQLMYTWFGLRRMGSILNGLSIRSDTSDTSEPIELAPTRGIILSNIKSHMGIGMTTLESDPTDTLIECVKASSPLDYLRMIACRYNLLSPLKSAHRGTDISVDNIPPHTHVQLDGEALPPIQSGSMRITFRKFVTLLTGNR